jgi:3-hydroxyisobutyrate dehydrogenase
VLVDHSTTDPAATRDMAARLRATCGSGWVDAPVSGGPIVARAGGLTVMAGGADADVARVMPVMQDLSANFTHLGPAGAGQVAKTINQAIVCANYVILAEALALAEAGGLNAALLPQCLAGGHADSTLLRTIYPQMQARAFVPPRSYARQLLKDLKSVAAFAAGHGLAVPMIQAALERYAAHVAAGHGLEDSTSIIRQYERAS